MIVEPPEHLSSEDSSSLLVEFERRGNVLVFHTTPSWLSSTILKKKRRCVEGYEVDVWPGRLW